MDVLFYAHNGTGLGHTRRVGLIIKEISAVAPSAKVAVLTNCPNRLFLEDTGAAIFAAPRTNIDEELTLGASAENAEFYSRMIQQLRPKVVVFDTHIPRMIKSRALQCGAKLVLIQRLVRKNVLARCVSNCEWDDFQAVIIPHSTYEVAERAEVWKESKYHEKVFIDGYVFDRALPQPAACEDFRVLISMGGGGRYLTRCGGKLATSSHGELVGTLVRVSTSLPRALDGRRDCVVLGLNADDSLLARVLAQARNSGVAIVKWLPSFRYSLTRAELLIARCGYNTFCETIYLKCPALFVPKEGRTELQSERSAMLEDWGGCAVCAERDTDVTVSLEELLNEPEKRETFKARLACFPLPWGNRRVAQRICCLVE